MVKLAQDNKGNFRARKRLPEDVRDEYGHRFGQRFEAKFYATASERDAPQKFRDWETEVDGRVAAIRAEPTGEGVSLTPRQARALAGEWCEWFTTDDDQMNKAVDVAIPDDAGRIVEVGAE